MAKRQTWIDEHVLAREVQVLVVNPGALGTGLHNLETFSKGGRFRRNGWSASGEYAWSPMRRGTERTSPAPRKDDLNSARDVVMNIRAAATG
jgi:hypothetical protein